MERADALSPGDLGQIPLVRNAATCALLRGWRPAQELADRKKSFVAFTVNPIV